MTVSEAVVQRIQTLCSERNITINKISTISGITQSTISDIVNHVTINPRMNTIKKLCDGFEISVRTFFDDEIFDNLEQEVK